MNVCSLQKSTSPKTVVVQCRSSRCALHTVVWFNSAPLKSHPGSIIIRLQPVPVPPILVNLRSIQKLTFERQTWWAECHEHKLNSSFNLLLSCDDIVTLFWILMLTDGKNSLPSLLNPFSPSPLPLGKAFQGQKFERDRLFKCTNPGGRFDSI